VPAGPGRSAGVAVRIARHVYPPFSFEKRCLSAL
jgi:hypothetical protein